ncbi:ATP-binding protein [Rhodoflexus caldus]|uniref:ATP-binding protein n=1 Tax=Rhodoflexus caldus TaxID=2891236 RepID=UPI00202A135F|nr:ATP-binding protein [Rhodoflexus caldus]
MKQQQQWEHHISLNCRRESLNTLRQFTKDVLSRWAITDEQQYLLVLALDEVCANLIIHSHSCNDSDTIDIKISRANDGVYFEVRDSKPDSFNMALYETPTVSQILCEKKRSGIGLFLVKQIMDEIMVEQSADMKICRMKKKLSF